jgi:hypothetical protein
LTFPKFVGSLAKRSQRSIWGNLCVLSLIDDIAVFCAPDSQELSEQCKAFDQFTATAMMVANPPTVISPYEWHDVPGALAWVLSLDLKWLPCRVHNNGRLLVTTGAKIEGGMSGSPILNAEGYAIGLISITGADDRGPCLASCLPPWLWRRLKVQECGSHQDALHGSNSA